MNNFTLSTLRLGTYPRLKTLECHLRQAGKGFKVRLESNDSISNKGEFITKTIRSRTKLFAAIAAPLVVVGATVVPLTAGVSASATTPTVTLNITGVPSLTEGLITVARKMGYFAKYHIKVNWTDAQGGSAVVAAVVGGSADLGYTADTPPLKALAGGAPLHFVVGQDTIGRSGNLVAFTKASTGITSWANIGANTGVTLESNAPFSMGALALLAAAYKANPSQMSNICGGACPDGPVVNGAASLNLMGEDALTGVASVVAAFYPQAAEIKDTTSLVSLGDPLAYVFPVGTPYAMFFTSSSLWTHAGAKKAALRNFAAAMKMAITYGNKHLAQVYAYGAAATHSPVALATNASLTPRVPFNATITAASLANVVTQMANVGWSVPTADQLNAFFR
jgi:ABC-type nitrate/sulfonate/bicarbonate transport system substrate-binding protein